jgi:hypothetical protein
MENLTGRPMLGLLFFPFENNIRGAMFGWNVLAM